jgi:hypothetical protein
MNNTTLPFDLVIFCEDNIYTIGTPYNLLITKNYNETKI